METLRIGSKNPSGHPRSPNSRNRPEGNTVGVRLTLPDETSFEAPWLWRPSRSRKEARITDPLPSTVRVVVSNLVYVEKKELPSGMLDRLIRIAAFQNPEFYKAQAMRLS